MCYRLSERVFLTRRGTRVDSSVVKRFITYGKPYHAASIDTLKRWVYMIYFQGQDC